MTDTPRKPTPLAVGTAALKADNWSNPGKAVKTVLDAFDAAGITVDHAGRLTADDLSEDVDLCMLCVGLAIGAAGAMLDSDDATAAIANVLHVWPDEVPDAAFTVGLRVALAIAAAVMSPVDPDANMSAADLGAIAATILETSDTESEGTE